MKAFLRGLCKAYKGEETNPTDKLKDEFRYYIWEREKAILEQSPEFKEEDDAEEYFKKEIQAAIDLFADVPLGGDPSTYYDRYFTL